MPQECLFTAKYLTVCFFKKIFFFHCHGTMVEIRKLTPIPYSYLLHSPYSSFSSGPRAGVIHYHVSLGSFNLGTVHKSLYFMTLTFFFKNDSLLLLMVPHVGFSDASSRSDSGSTHLGDTAFSQCFISEHWCCSFTPELVMLTLLPCLWPCLPSFSTVKL